MTALRPGYSPPFDDDGDTTVTPGDADSGWNVWGDYTLGGLTSFNLEAYSPPFNDDGDTTVTPGDADSGWNVWGDYLLNGALCADDDIDIWAVEN